MRCASCGSENRDGRKFCSTCGTPLGSVCPSCGAPSEADARFCGECGRSLVGPAPGAGPSPAPQPVAAAPTAFARGRYLVQRFLGEGGRKRVYLAHDERLDREVAVAVIKTEGLDADGLTRVRREAQAMGRLGDHPNIVTVHDIGDEDAQPYIVSQFMAGGDLAGLLQSGANHRLSIEQAISIAGQVSRALEYAHGRGIIHRDLKPANIWLTEDGTAKLGDFGLAVALDRSRVTVAGTMLGTAAYMPPEQAMGRSADARSDLYSLGCVLYEMVTGRPPFLGDDTVAVISQHINTAPVAPAWHNHEIPKALEALIMRLLAKNPDERPESAAAAREGLSAVAGTASIVAEQATAGEANPLDRLAGGIFVGREKEMDELRAGLEDALSGRGRLLMLVGEPGIGKTRTSEELATYAGLRGAQVLWGRCYEGEGAPAYWPWVQVIRSYVQERDPQRLSSEMGPGAADIAEVVADVRERLPGLPAASPLEPDQARFRLFDSVTTFLKNASQQQPIVLMIDDLHWADKPSLLLLQFLARQLRGGRLLVLGTYRDIELRRQHPLSQALAELAREGLSRRVLLRGLTRGDVARFIEMTTGVRPPDALVEAVFKETEGNPFFVNEIVRLLVTDGRLDRPEEVTSWSVTIPQGVRDVVGRRLDHLSEECNGVLTIGSVIGREFGLDVLERVSDLAGDRLLDVLEEAVAARVIVEVPRVVGRYSFTHALIRETLYEELSTARKVRLHRQIGNVLEEFESASIESHLPQLAYHFCEAAQGGDIGKAIDYAKRAAERARALLAYEEAAGHYERALQVLDLQEPPDEVERFELLVGLADALQKEGNTAGAQGQFIRAAEIARRKQDYERLARATLGYADTQVFDVLSVDEKVLDLQRESLAGLSQEDSALRARLLASQAWRLYFSYRRREIPELSREAVEMARRVGDPGALAYTLSARYAALWGPAGDKDRLETATEMIEVAKSAGEKQWELTGHHFRLMVLLSLGDMAGVDKEAEAVTRLAEELRQPTFLWQAAIYPAMRAILEGSLVEAEDLARKALAVGQRTLTENAPQQFAAQLFAIRREQGRLKELEAATKLFVEQFPNIPAWRAALALLYVESGSEDQGQAELDRLAANDFADIPDDANHPIALGLLTEVCARLKDVRRASVLYRLVLPYSSSCIVIGTGSDTYGSMARVAGKLATMLERWEEAEAHFQAALEMNANIGSRRWLSWTQHDYARMLLSRGGADDREKALDMLTRCLATAEEMGFKKLLEYALTLRLEAQGVTSADAKTSIDAVAALVYREKPDLASRAAPDGTVTILFSDIERSTEITERLGDRRWMELLREHNAIVREQLRKYGGFEVKSEGDGFMVAFGSARRAIECAVEIQRAMSRRNSAAREPLRVRMGLHTGEALKEGEDFYGRHVILAARIAAEAAGGQILVSSLLKELTGSAGDIDFGEGREVELKGLSGRHAIFAVGWKDS